jgi:hypothetical protein
MPELGNVEVAKTLHETAVDDERHKRRSERILEIAEALLLAIVAIATAWSGYQSARWDGRQALQYGEASRMRITADQITTRGGQQRLYDITTFNSWAQAKFSGDDKLAAVFERRFRPEYLVAFHAWMKLNPLNNPHAPPGPVFMPEYHNALNEEGAKMQAQASTIFDAGTAARETGDDYVRTTVFLATVLFIIALGQRFKVRAVRLTLLATAGVFLAVALFSLSTYPHI